MATDDTTTQPVDLRKEYRRMMYRKLRHTRELARVRVNEDVQINENELDEYRITVGEDISLEPGAIDFGPRFCEPFPASRLKELYKTRWQYDDDPPSKFPNPCELLDGMQISRHLTTIIGHRIADWTLAPSTPWDTIAPTAGRRSPFTILAHPHVSPSMPGWAMLDVRRISDESLPHTSCTMFDYSEIAPDDRLRTAELYCAVSLMMQALRLDRKKLIFKVSPVFIFSFSQRYARFIQTHFDGETLVVRKTKWVYFPHNQDVSEEVELFLQWMMCTPIGSTRFPALPNEGSIEHASQQRKPSSIVA